MIKIIIYSIVWSLLWPLAFLVTISRNRKAIIVDVQKDIEHRRFKISGISSVLYVFLLDKYYRALIYKRLGLKSRMLSWLWHTDATFFPVCGDIGEGCYLAHPFATILNAKSIGRNFTCRQNTTIGNKSEECPWDRPVIGDNVTLGANVVVIGNIVIGNNSVIGAGSVVVKDVPENAVIAGNPARIIKYTNQ